MALTRARGASAASAATRSRNGIASSRGGSSRPQMRPNTVIRYASRAPARTAAAAASPRARAASPPELLMSVAMRDRMLTCGAAHERDCRPPSLCPRLVARGEHLVLGEAARAAGTALLLRAAERAPRLVDRRAPA